MVLRTSLRWALQPTDFRTQLAVAELSAALLEGQACICAPDPLCLAALPAATGRAMWWRFEQWTSHPLWCRKRSRSLAARQAPARHSGPSRRGRQDVRCCCARAAPCSWQRPRPLPACCGMAIAWSGGCAMQQPRCQRMERSTTVSLPTTATAAARWVSCGLRAWLGFGRQSQVGWSHWPPPAAARLRCCQTALLLSHLTFGSVLACH